MTILQYSTSLGIAVCMLLFLMFILGRPKNKGTTIIIHTEEDVKVTVERAMRTQIQVIFKDHTDKYAKIAAVLNAPPEHKPRIVVTTNNRRNHHV